VIFEKNPEMNDEELEAVVGGALSHGQSVGISYGVAFLVVFALAAA
jgi:bacteriocin-like protein